MKKFSTSSRVYKEHNFKDPIWEQIHCHVAQKVDPSDIKIDGVQKPTQRRHIHLRTGLIWLKFPENL